MPIIINKSLIPNHQFGFRQKHATIEQIHRLTTRIHKEFETKRYCSAIFLDISQVFDKVWHDGILYKIKQNLPHYFNILKSYLQERHFMVKQDDAVSQLHKITAGVPQGSVLGLVLYLLYTADLLNTNGITTATYADDTALLAAHENPIIALEILQKGIDEIHCWTRKWRIKINETKSIQVTFTTRKDTCPIVTINKQPVSQADDAKYLGIYLDRRLTWKKHIFTKCKQLGHQLSKMYWLIGGTSQLSMNSKLLLYKSILKPIWTYGIQLWGTAANSNIEILQRFQSKMLRIITKASWYVTNDQLHKDLMTPTVRDEIKNHTINYKDRIQVHPNAYASKLIREPNITRRLKRKISRFNIISILFNFLFSIKGCSPFTSFLSYH